MNTIDHRILIPSAQPTVWKYVSDLSNNARWQVNCRASTPLTTMRDGPGARWRLSGDRGRDAVIEITAWYDGLGYEYRYIDGSPYRESQGRLRLQEVAEGTVVQWTFNYELGGVFSGLRNSLGVRRSVETDMTDSLWTLWRHITQAEPLELDAIKSLMRDAPDVEARANYQPRHPSVLEQRAPEIRDFPVSGITVETMEAPVYPEQAQPAAPQPAAIIDAPIFDEPPVADDDTRPRATMAEEAAPPAPTPVTREPSVNEPDFLVTMSDDMMDELAESQRLKPVDDSKVAEVAERIDRLIAAPPEPPLAEEPVTVPAPPAAQPDAEAAEESAEPLATPESLGRSKPAGKEYELPRLEDDDEIEGDIDTSKVSVFELFGLPKPSQTQEIEAVRIDETSAPASPESVAPVVGKAIPAADPTPVTLRRTGKRLLLRRTLINLRLPK